MTMSGYAYTCNAGESFDSIARRIWGDEKYACELMCVNPEHATTLRFGGGEELKLPAISPRTEVAENGVMEPEKAPWRE